MPALLRVFKSAFEDLGRNPGLSVMTVFVLILMLLSVNALWTVDVITKQAVRQVKDQVNVSIYLTTAASAKDVEGLRTFLLSIPQVTDIQLLNSKDVLGQFQTRHEFNAEVLQALNELGGNPFGATLIVRTHEPQDYTTVLDAVRAPEYDRIIDGKSFDGHEDALVKIQNITNRIEQIGLALSLVFAVVAFLIIFNTIRVAIFTQRREISIKRLVGANNWFIRAPYLIESVLFSVLAIIITGALLYFGSGYLDQYLRVVFAGSFSLTNYYRANILYLFGIETAAVLALTILSSSLAMRRQLKV